MPEPTIKIRPRPVVSVARMKIASPIGSRPPASFISVSLTTNAAIASSIAPIPRRFSERPCA